MRRTISFASVLFVLALALLMGGGIASGSTDQTIVVKSSDLAAAPAELAAGAWFFYNDETDVVDNALGSFVSGPATAPAGDGSAQISVSGSQRRNLATYRFSGTALADITVLRFSTYNPSAGNGGSATRSGYLNFNADFNGTDTWQRRLVFVPSQNGTVLQDTWQEWDAINGGAAMWSYSGAMWPGTATPGTTLRSWSDVLAAYPGIRIRVTDSWLGVRVGEPYADGYTENIDAFKFGTAAGTTTFDFEPQTPCTSVCYVDAVNGDDAFGGDTAGSAKKTIAAALAQVGAGGQVRVLPGTYNETSPGSAPTTIGGTYTFGLFFPSDKPGVSLIGVDAADQPITDATATEATVNTIGDANFGPDGIFVEAANTTIQGIKIGGNSPYDNKTIEVLADNFTLKYSATDVPNGGGSVYFNDPSVDGSVIETYHILNNAFLDGTSVDLTSGAGLTGLPSGREIKNNTFDLQDNGFNAISFNGSDTGVPWFVNSVGGAVITGNSFSNSTQYIRARGTYDNSQFDWASYFNDNTFDRAVVFGANPPTSVGEWSYASGPYTFNHVRRIASVIQTEIDHAQPGDTVLVKDGTYPESPNITKSLTLVSDGGAAVTTIELQAGPTYLGALTIGGDDVTVDGFTIAGRDGTASVIAASNILVQSNLTSVTIKNNVFEVGLIDDATSTGDDGFGILTTYTETPADFVGSLTVTGNVFEPLTSAGGRAFYVNPGVTTFDFVDNDITGNFARSAITQATDGLVQDNTLTGSGASAGLATWGYPDPDVYGKTHFTGNSITDVTSAITVFETNNVTIDHNLISDSTNAVRVLDLGTFSGDLDPTSVLVNRNSLSVGVAGNGIAAAAGFSDPVEATCNWWGTATGPGAIAAGAGSLVSSNVDYLPWLVSDDLAGACTAITLSAAAADASGNEGSLQSTGGSFSNPAATITSDAAFGTFTDNLNGTWTWSYTPTDQFGPSTITVTATDPNGTTASDSFAASATNVNPTATFNSPLDALYSSTFQIGLSGAADVSAVDQAAGFTYAFDCGSGTFGAASASATTNCTAPADPGAITVRGKVFDKDGGSTIYSAGVEVTQPEIALSPASRDFGSVLVSTDSAPYSFTVKNVGTADLAITDVGLGGTNPGHFAIDSNGCFEATLAPDETCTIDVFFSPGSVGAKSARLVVESDDPDSPSVNSTLAGTGSVASNGLITIVLDAHPEGSQSFPFNGTGGIGAFNLVDDGSPSDTAQFSEPAGQYTFSVDNPAGWTLTDLECDAPETISLNAGIVIVDLGAGENVTCTFTESLPQPDGLIAAATGPFIGDDIYSAAVLPSQTMAQAFTGKETKSFWVTIQNEALLSSRFSLNADLNGWKKFKVHFYFGGTDITGSVKAGTYRFTLAAGDTRTIEVRVNASTTSGHGKARDITLIAKSTTFGGARDVVRAHATHV